MLFPVQPFRSMSTDRELRSLEQLLDRLGEVARGEGRVTLNDVLDVVGRRSFGPMLLVAGLITVMPVVGDIPGVPTIVGTFVLLVAGQLLLRREHIWLPRWLLERSVPRDKLRKSIEWLHRPAQFIDRFLRPRLQGFTRHTAAYAVAIASTGIALVMPALEVIPFSANLAGAALTAFGLALIAHDGFLALFAFAFTIGTFGMVVYNLF